MECSLDRAGANPSVPQICFDTLLIVMLLERKWGKSKLLWLVFHFLWSSITTPPKCLGLHVLGYKPNYSRILEIWIKSGLQRVQNAFTPPKVTCK